MAEPIQVVIGEDDVLLREGIARILTEAGLEVVSQAGDAEAFLRKALAHRPDVAVVDIRMPPGHGDDGLQAALTLRQRLPGTGVLVLSQHYEDQYAIDLIGDSAEGVGLTDADSRDGPHLSRNPNRNLSSGLLQGFWAHGSCHLLACDSALRTAFADHFLGYISMMPTQYLTQ